MNRSNASTSICLYMYPLKTITIMLPTCAIQGMASSLNVTREEHLFEATMSCHLLQAWPTLYGTEKDINSAQVMLFHTRTRRYDVVSFTARLAYIIRY